LLRRIRVPAAPSEDAPIEQKLGEMMVVLNEDAARRELVESHYRDKGISVTGFARAVGRPVFNTVRYLASEPLLGVNAVDGNLERLELAQSILHKNAVLVLDSTTLASVLLLDLFELLPKLGVQLLVPQAVLDEVRKLSLNIRRERGPKGVLGLVGGKVQFTELSPAEMAREVELLERVMTFVRNHCTVCDGEATLHLPTPIRNQLKSDVGDSATDAIALAKQKNAILWSDDFAFRKLAAIPELDIKNTGTQALFHWAAKVDSIQREEYVKVLEALINSNYHFLHFSAIDVVDLLKASAWKLNSYVSTALVRHVTQYALVNIHNMSVTTYLFFLIVKLAPNRGRAREVIGAILNGIGRTRSGPQLASHIYRRTSKQLMVNPDYRSLKRMLRAWRSRDGEFKPPRRRRRD